jgi:protein SCO1/2
MRLALIEAGNNTIGNPIDQILLYCYHYDPLTGKYGVLIMNVVRLAGSVTVLGLGAFMAVMFRRDRRKAAADGEAR